MALITVPMDFDPDYVQMLNDILRMGIIQIVVQVLFSIVNPAENPFFSTIFLQTIGFVVIGVLVYWLVIRSLIQFKSSSGQNTPSFPFLPETFKSHEKLHTHKSKTHHTKSTHNDLTHDLTSMFDSNKKETNSHKHEHEHDHDHLHDIPEKKTPSKKNHDAKTRTSKRGKSHHKQDTIHSLLGRHDLLSDEDGE